MLSLSLMRQLHIGIIGFILIYRKYYRRDGNSVKNCFDEE